MGFFPVSRAGLTPYDAMNDHDEGRPGLGGLQPASSSRTAMISPMLTACSPAKASKTSTTSSITGRAMAPRKTPATSTTRDEYMVPEEYDHLIEDASRLLLAGLSAAHQRRLRRLLATLSPLRSGRDALRATLNMGPWASPDVAAGFQKLQSVAQEAGYLGAEGVPRRGTVAGRGLPALLGRRHQGSLRLHR